MHGHIIGQRASQKSVFLFCETPSANASKVKYLLYPYSLIRHYSNDFYKKTATEKKIELRHLSKDDFTLECPKSNN